MILLIEKFTTKHQQRSRSHSYIFQLLKFVPHCFQIFRTGLRSKFQELPIIWIWITKKNALQFLSIFFFTTTKCFFVSPFHRKPHNHRAYLCTFWTLFFVHKKHKRNLKESSFLLYLVHFDRSLASFTESWFHLQIVYCFNFVCFFSI